MPCAPALLRMRTHARLPSAHENCDVLFGVGGNDKAERAAVFAKWGDTPLGYSDTFTRPVNIKHGLSGLNGTIGIHQTRESPVPAEPPTVRPRQHVLEDLSERAFTNITPAEWVARPVAKDYGIDFEVEIFDQSGRRTGLTYKVQLKSTDATSGGRSVKVSDLEYWNSLDVPVLLVLHRAGSNETFSAWAHAHNPWPPVEDQATTTVHFTEQYGDHVERIPDELELIRQVKQKATKLPVTIGVAHADSPTARTLRGELRAAVEQCDLSRVVKVVSTDPYITISVTDDAMSASSPTNASSTTAHGQDLTHPADPAQRAPHQLVLVAMALSQLRSDHAAGELLTALRRHITDNMLGTTADGIATAFARDHRWGDLLTMLTYVGSDAETTTRVLDIVERYARHMPPELVAEFIDLCRQNAAYLTSIDLPADASQRHFVAAQIAVDHDLWEDVKADLAAATRILPGHYENDDRYCQLAGKAEWNTDNREAALPWYEEPGISAGRQSSRSPRTPKPSSSTASTRERATCWVPQTPTSSAGGAPSFTAPSTASSNSPGSQTRPVARTRTKTRLTKNSRTPKTPRSS